MFEPVSALADAVANLDSFQRMMALWAFCIGGILLAVQISQTGEPNGMRWTKLTPEQAPFWYTFYVFQAILFVTGAYPMMLQKMDGLLGGFEQVTLNGIWILLVGIEILMVVGVAFTTVTRTLRSAPKQKAQ